MAQIIQGKYYYEINDDWVSPMLQVINLDKIKSHCI